MKRLIFTLIPLLILCSCGKAPDPVQIAKSTEDISERMKIAEEALRSKISDQQFDELTSILARDYGEAGKFDNMQRLIEALKARGTQNSAAMNTIARNLIESETFLAQGLEAAETAIRWTRNPDPQNRPQDISQSAWEQRLKWRLSAYLDTYALGLVKSNRQDEAVSALNEAVNLDKENTDALLRLAEMDLAINKANEAFKLIVQAKLYGAEEKVDSLAKVAYSMLLRTEKGFDVYFNGALQELKMSEQREMVNNRLNLPAPNFTLKDLEGRNVSLSDFRGKIVFIDFWATWCGPCRKVLPILQAFYDRYKDQDVIFLAINTDKETDKVLPFIQENGYTFKVLYDKGMKTAYDVAGIPTVFILNKDGIIRYKHIGYRADLAEIWEAQLAELKK